MPDEKPLTDYRSNIAKSGNTVLLRAGLVTPDEAEGTGETMKLKTPNPPLRILLRPDPLW
jgi:hypothetical protein